MTDAITQRGCYEVLHDPDEDGALVGPLHAYDVGETLHLGCFTPGTRLKFTKTGETFLIVGDVGHQQRMIVEGSGIEKTIGLPYYKARKLKQEAMA